MESFVFYIFALMTITGGWIVIYSRNLIYSAFSLLITFVGLAGLYGLLMADFIAATQILIYAGAVLILLLFGIMLTARKTSIEITQSNLPRLPGAIISSLIFLLLMVVIFSEPNWNSATNPGVRETVPMIGKLLMTKYLIPFELASILLLAALIGSVFIARREES
ncbi:MAG: NADH-quinone oxidoreductase subunit J [Candidatus Marinimicrobia bacterium]|nr:NADH-quinone oxidoreductase subunit J [Candidatus Neomarinimicrobiota bacterium]TFB10573.1 NADH-quinone oxidoreductase subunit J [Candidatus Marinimicrobia bacterium MT.SAG.2]